MARTGILFVLSGPSGAGKGTVLGKVLERLENIAVSVSVTTREPRAGEIDGIHYYFKTRDEFQQMVDNNEFLEYVAKFKNKYGTPKAPVRQMLDNGIDVILEIETNGASKVRKSFPKACLIFVTPSSYGELSHRLDSRGSETQETKALRLKIAKAEYRCMKHYNYVVINDDLTDCIDNVEAIIKAERNKTVRNPELLTKFFDD